MDWCKLSVPNFNAQLSNTVAELRGAGGLSSQSKRHLVVLGEASTWSKRHHRLTPAQARYANWFYI
jgi:hypothetical protein